VHARQIVGAGACAWGRDTSPSGPRSGLDPASDASLGTFWPRRSNRIFVDKVGISRLAGFKARWIVANMQKSVLSIGTRAITRKTPGRCDFS
jgi:hypothetical protein